MFANVPQEILKLRMSNGRQYSRAQFLHNTVPGKTPW